MPERLNKLKAASRTCGAALGMCGLLLSISACADNPAFQSQAADITPTEVPDGKPDIPDHVGEILDGDEQQSISYFRIGDNMQMGSPNQREEIPALSLIKLYIATYVLEHGEFADKYEALDMVSSSSDESAEELFDAYPDAIDIIAEEYGLESTKAGETWGYSTTSTYDVVSFITQLKEKDPTHPVLVAMAQADSISADGYRQNYGTAKLQNVIGSKWGWSNNKDLHSSVSFGENFVVAASSWGSARDLTRYVRKEISVDNLNKATTRYIDARKGEKVEPLTTTSRPSKERDADKDKDDD